MKVGLFLHAYQPPTQFPQVTEAITQESYIPIVKLLSQKRKAKMTLNLTGALSEQLLGLGFSVLIKDISKLVIEGRLELTATAAYHPLLTGLPKSEIIRQIKINHLINSWALGEGNFNPEGFFLPEMVYSREVAEVIAELGFRWIILDESAFPRVRLSQESEGSHLALQIGNKLHKISRLSIVVFFRDRPISLKVAFDQNYEISDLLKDLRLHYLDGQESYAIIAVDAETFGHHQHNNLDLLEALFDHPNIELVTLSELMRFPLEKDILEPKRSTWGITLENQDQQRTFPRWDNPDNPIHQLQWELFWLAFSIGQHKGNNPDLLDRALHSDQFWWASHNPCWHPEMVHRGAEMLRDVVTKSNKANKHDVSYATLLYSKIIEMGKELYGDTVIPC